MSRSWRPGAGKTYVLTTEEGSFELAYDEAAAKCRESGADVVLNLVCRTLEVPGRGCRFIGRQEVVMGLLLALTRRGGHPVDHEVLFEEAWGLRYCKRFHRRTLHYGVNRVRRLLEELGASDDLIQSGRGSYRFNPRARYCLLEGPLASSEIVPRGDSEALVGHMSQAGCLTAQDYRRLVGVGRSTASRELRRLTQQGVLVRRGTGRATTYVLP